MKTAMQELMDWIQDEEFHVTKAFVNKLYESLEKEKEQIIAPVNRLCDFYGHPHIGEQMYNVWYVPNGLKPLTKKEY